MSWDFGYDEQDSFLQDSFANDDAMFLTGSPPRDDLFGSLADPVVPELIQTPQSQQEAETPESGAADPAMTLANENDSLKVFFFHLKEKADQVESVNTRLKSQLEECRQWFKQAMFYGASNQLKN